MLWLIRSAGPRLVETVIFNAFAAFMRFGLEGYRSVVMVTETLADRGPRERALDPGRSFIVEAPAGSGKTTLLRHLLENSSTEIQSVVNDIG